MIEIVKLNTIWFNQIEIKKYSDEIIDSNFKVEIVFVGIEEMKKLNKNYRNINTATDILTFTDGNIESLHQIIICPEIAQKNCSKYQNTLGKELKLLIFHGWQHITGKHHH